MAKLLTDHDPAHIHALFGLLTLFHIIYRLNLLFRDVRDIGFGSNWQQDQVSLILMSLPNVSSFVFEHVPVKKGTDDGFTIWKEYRWHALIFAGRCWFMMLFLMACRQYYNSDGDLPYLLNKGFRIGVVFMAMILAKVATDSYPPQVSTIRGMYKSSFTSFIAGFMQYLATSMTLVGSSTDDFGLQFYGLSVVQLNAFNMTMRKKRKIGSFTTQMFYSTMLSTGLYLFLLRRFIEQPPYGIFEARFKFVYLAIIAYVTRVKLRQSRFMAWIVGLTITEVLENKYNFFQAGIVD